MCQVNNKQATFLLKNCEFCVNNLSHSCCCFFLNCSPASDKMQANTQHKPKRLTVLSIVMGRAAELTHLLYSIWILDQRPLRGPVYSSGLWSSDVFLLEPLLLFGLYLSPTTVSTSVPVVPLAPGTAPSFRAAPVRHCCQWGLPYLSQLPPSASL